MRRSKDKIISYLKYMNMEKGLEILFQIMIFSSFWGPVLLAVTVPGIGEIFLFRIALAAVCCFYIYYIINKKTNPFKARTRIEYVIFLILGIMLLYGGISLVRAIDFGYTFRRLFNLGFDLMFLLMIILYIDNQRKVRITMVNCIINVLLLQFMGVYETFFGGVFYDTYDNFLRVPFFNRLLQPPTVSYGNTNDYITSILFCLPFIIIFLIYQINNSKNIKTKRIFSSILIINLSLTYFLANAARAQLGQLAWFIIFLGFAAYILVSQRKQYKLAVMIFVCFLFVSFTENYLILRATTLNAINTMKYERELKSIEKKVASGDAEAAEAIKSVPTPKLVTVPKSNELSIKDQFVAKNEETGKTVLNMNASGGGRLMLIKFAGDTFIDSYGMGVGLGNTEQRAKVIAEEQLGGLWAIHCFPARIIADMGIFLLFPVLIAIFLLLKSIIYILKDRQKPKLMNMVMFFIILSLLCFPILSTIPSDAQDTLGMWLCLGGIIIAVTKHHAILNMK